MKASVVLNPATPVQVLEDIIHELDMVLVMSVNPGFGGQKFIKSSIKKIKQLNKLRIEMNLNYQIEKVRGEIVNLQQLMEKSPRELRGVFENKISQLENNAIYLL